MKKQCDKESHTEKKPDLLVCPVIKGDTKQLTKAQKDFNSLNKRIKDLRDKLKIMPERAQRMQVAFREKVYPLLPELVLAEGDKIIALDELYESHVFLEQDNEVLACLILEDCKDWLVEDKDDMPDYTERIRKLEDKYELVLTGLTGEERERQKVEETLSFLHDFLGLDLTPDMQNAKTEEELNEIIQRYREELFREVKEKDPEKQRPLFDEEEMMGEKARFTHGFEREKKKTKAELQEEQLKKSLRTIYLELAKSIHPDRELDPELRAQKEEQMKQLSAAYQKQDLSALLLMQINWLEESTKDPEKQSDNVLKEYNRILRRQIKQLNQEIEHFLANGFSEVYDTSFLFYGESEYKYFLRSWYTSERAKMKRAITKAKKSASKESVIKRMRSYIKQQAREADIFGLWDDVF